MRHLWSVLLAMVLTPLIYAGAGVSAVRLTEGGGLGTHSAIGLGAAFLAGALYAVLVMARLSPLGPVVSGLLYLGVTIWSLLDKAGFERIIPADLFGEKGVLHRPVGMGTALLAAPLIFTVFSARRWRSTANVPAQSFDAAPEYKPTVAVPSYTDSPTPVVPAYAPSSSFAAAPSYEPPVYTPPAYNPPTYPAPMPSSGAQPAGDDSQRTGLM